MDNRKVWLFFLALGALALVLLFPFQTSNVAFEKKLIDAVSQGQFTKAHEFLDDTALDQNKRYLYNAALLTLNYQPKLSNECIQNLELLYGKVPIESDIQEQLTLLKISNAFLEGNLPHFFTLCQSSNNLLQNSLYKEFISAIVCLKNQDYTGAKIHFNQSNIKANGTIASVAFITIFKESVIEEFQLRMALDQDNLVEAKQETYSLAKLQLDPASIERIYLIILKKSGLGQEAVVSLIKPIAEKNRVAIAALFQKNFADLLAQADYKGAAFLLSVMSSVEEKDELAQAFEPLQKMASSERRQAILAICEESANEKKARQFLSYGAIIAIAVDSHEEVTAYVDILKQVTKENKDCHLAELREEMERSLLALTSENNISADALKEKLELYKKMQPEPQDLDVLCYRIVQNSFSYPLPECGDSMISCWKMLFREPLTDDCKSSITSLINQFIEKTDADLLNDRNSFKVLVFLEQAEKVIHSATIANKIKENASKLSNLLFSDLERGNYVQAAQMYQLVQSASPKDPSTKYTKALLEYVQGNPADLIAYFEKECPQAVLNGSIKSVGEFLSAPSSEQQLLLSKLVEKGKLEPALLFSLGMVELYLGRLELAKIALLAHSKTSLHAKALLSFITFSQKNYAETLELIGQLPQDIRSSEPIQAMELLSYIQLDQKKEAILFVQNSIAESNRTKNRTAWINSLPSEWRMLWQQKKEGFQFSYALAVFYSKVEENPRQSLFWFQQVENPSFSTQLEEVGLAVRMAQFTRAESLLQTLQTKLAEEPEGIEKESRKLLLNLAMADIFLSEGKEVKADQLLRQLIEIYPNNEAIIRAFAKLYCRELRFDLALELYKDLCSKLEPSVQDKLGQLTALVHTKSFDAACALAMKLEKSKELSTTETLQLCKNMIYAGVPSYIEQFIKNNTIPLTTVASIEFLDLLRIQGEYKQALAFFEGNEAALTKEPGALYQKALILEAISERQDAVRIAKQAYELSPEDRDICAFLDRYEMDSHWIEKRLHSLISKMDLVASVYEPDLIPVIYDATELLLRIDREKLALISISQTDCRRMFTTCRNYLQKLSRLYIYLPRILYYYGMAEQSLGKVGHDKKYLKMAYKFAPSYDQAAAALGSIAMNKKKYSSAKSYFMQAITFNPCNASFWVLLAAANEKADDLVGARYAIEQAHKFRPNDSGLIVQSQ